MSVPLLIAGFPLCRLTAKERADAKYRRDVLEYAKKHAQAGEIEKAPRYHMPDARVVREIPKEYVEEPAGGDGRRWEDERLLAAMQHYGAKDADKSRPEFDLLLDEEKIDFVQALQMPGIGDQDTKVTSEAEKRKQSLAETRRSLPVFPFREQFIQAVRDHQVLIVEGETGSGKTTQLPQYLYEAVSPRERGE